MKKFIFMAFTALCLLSCQDGIWNAINELKDEYAELEKRVARLEELCKEMNTNISSLQTIVNVLQSNDYIASITPIMKDGKEIGYVITFGKHDPITIYHGQDGQDGKDGKDGAGSGSVPILGVAQDTDGVYYWTLNGEWLLDANNNKLRVTGQDGQNGTNGVTPQLKIENDYWYVSYDNGVTWTQLGKAKGDDGSGGTSGDSMFQSVTYDDDYVYFTLVNGTTLTVRKANSDFDQTVIDNLVTSLTLDKTEVWINTIGGTVQIIATTTPFPTSKVYWTSSDSTIVAVNDGQLTAIRTGQVTVTAKAGDKSQQLEAYVAIGDGLLSGEFSISETQKVSFSKGRLQYNPAQGTHRCADGTTKPGTWRFAENQYDTVNVWCPNTLPNGWYDLFGYGQSGYDTYVPWGSSTVAGNLNENTDWGRYNAIENGDNIPDQWRCLTQGEWYFLINSRTNASNLKKQCSIDNISGMIYFPDNFTNANNINLSKLTGYSMEEWLAMEQEGAIFCPFKINYRSYYSSWFFISWTQTGCGHSTGYGVTQNGTVDTWQYGSGALPVRLVQDVK